MAPRREAKRKKMKSTATSRSRTTTTTKDTTKDDACLEEDDCQCYLRKALFLPPGMDEQHDQDEQRRQQGSKM
jgi:hypothetical protein